MKSRLRPYRLGQWTGLGWVLTGLLSGLFQNPAFALLTPRLSAPNSEVSNSASVLAQAPAFEYEDFEFWADQCRLLSQETDYPKTLETCEQAIGLRPKEPNLDLWFARSYALFQLGAYADAIGSFERVLQYAPKDSISLTYQCAARFQLFRLEDAVDTCEEALQIDGNWGTMSPALAWYYRGLALQSMGRLETALASYDRALLITPDDLLVKAGRCAIAAELRHTAVSPSHDCSLATAVEAYEQALAVDPDNATLWFQQGLVLEQLGRFEQALTSYESAIATKPDYSLALAHQCAVLNELETYEAALAACDAALKGDDHWDRLGSVFGWSQRSAAQIGLEDYEGALASADRAIAIDPTYSGGWNNRAVSLWYLKELDNAERAIAIARQQEDQIISPPPDNAIGNPTAATNNPPPSLVDDFERTYPEPQILFYRRSAVTAYNQGSILLDLYLENRYVSSYLDQARAAYRRAIDLQSQWQPKLSEGSFLNNNFLSDVWTNYAITQFYAKESYAAINSALRAKNYNSNSFDVWFNLGMLYLAVGDYSAAENAYAEAASRDPERPDLTDIWYTIGRAALANEDYREAWEVYEAAAVREPERVDAVLGQGLSLQGLALSSGTNCDLELLTVFERILNLDPSNRTIQQQYTNLTQKNPSASDTPPIPSNCPIRLQ